MKKDILITGIEGFAGRHLVNELLENPSLYDRLSAINHPDISVSHLDGLGIDLSPCDITDKEGLFKVLSDVMPSYIVHLAAISFVPSAMKNPLRTWQVNLFGGLHILEWVRQFSPKTRVLMVSTGEVYGAPESSSELPFNELSLLRPASVYSATKSALDNAAHHYARTWGLDIVVARPFNHIGAWQSSDFVVSSFARQVAMVKLGKAEPVIHVGNLSAERDFTDVRDVVRAYRLLLLSDVGGVFNISGGRSVGIRAILDN
jgi:GDP-4-dehydro-6-deoxy-D-mannose reductase